MHDRQMQIQLTTTLAAISGSVGVAMVAANFFFVSDNLGFAGVTFVCLAATLRVRSWFVRMGERMAERERAAYQVGRESVRSIH